MRQSDSNLVNVLSGGVGRKQSPQVKDDKVYSEDRELFDVQVPFQQHSGNFESSPSPQLAVDVVATEMRRQPGKKKSQNNFDSPHYARAQNLNKNNS